MTTNKLLLTLFGGFALVGVALFVISRVRFQEGQGLHESVQSQILLQLATVADPKLKVDFRADMQAMRVSYDTPSSMGLVFKNLSTESKNLTVRTDFFPPESAGAFDFGGALASISLAPREAKEIKVPFTIKKEKSKTLDGTLSLKFFLMKKNSE